MARVALRYGIKFPMENIKIKRLGCIMWAVIADTKRFGTAEIMYQGPDCESCVKYVRELSGNANFAIEMDDIFSDRYVWYARHYSDGHYHFNRGVRQDDGSVKMINKRYERGWKAFVMDIFNYQCDTEKSVMFA